MKVEAHEETIVQKTFTWELNEDEALALACILGSTVRKDMQVIASRLFYQLPGSVREERCTNNFGSSPDECYADRIAETEYSG